MSVLRVDKQNFEEVKKNAGPVLLDFYADWCGPCRMVSPIVDQIAEENPRYLVGKINVDDCPAIAEKYGIMTIPAVFIFKNGEIVEKMVGLRQKVQLAAALNKYL